MDKVRKLTEEEIEEWKRERENKLVSWMKEYIKEHEENNEANKEN